MKRPGPVLAALLAAASLVPSLARAQPAPALLPATVEVAAPGRTLFCASGESGWDDNVRLLAPVEVVPGVAVADGYGGARLGLARSPGLEGAVVGASVSARQFFSANDGTLAAAAARAGWRWGWGGLRLEPAVELTAFTWSAFPSDQHLAFSLAPSLSLTRGRLTLSLLPSAVARRFASGTDLEAWGELSATVAVGRLTLWAAASGGGVDSATPELSRTLARGDVGARLQLSPAWRAEAALEGALKNLPAFPPATDGGPPGRSDALVGGRLSVRWQLARTLALVVLADGLWSSSTSSVGDYSELAGSAALEWSWEPAGWRHARLLGPREVTFRLEAPGAAQVQLAGNFSGWEPLAMDRRGGAWELTVPLPPGDQRYGFLVDGRWTLPKNARLASDGFGGEDALVSVGAE